MSVTEQEIQAITVAPRVTLQDVKDFIKSEEFLYTQTLTFCVLTLENGFTVTGESACASPANYNKEIGDRLAKESAINKIWGLLGFELKSKLHMIEQAGQPSGKILELGSPRTALGAKVIHFVAMTLGEYNSYRGWELPANEDADTNGYLVEYTDGGKPNVEGHLGYVSWSPADVFERAYGTAVRQEPETFLTRLAKERDQMIEWKDKLGKFFDTGKFQELGSEARGDLLLQHQLQTQLAFILSKRYDDLTQ